MLSTVVVCDSHPLYLTALAELIERSDLFALAGRTADGRECIDLLEAHRPGACVLDLTSPEVDGLDVISHAGRLGLPTRFLVLSAFSDRATVYKALSAGAAGYLLKTATQEAILEALTRIVEGGNVLSADLSEGLVRQISEQGGAPPATLTERECQVLRQLCEGGSAAEIGTKLYLGSATVRTHLSRIYEKLGVSGRAGAVAVALRNGLVD
jgi:two-component system, NarL family, nitrate/nitrite response regulator NarL